MTDSPKKFPLWNIAKIILALILVWFVLSKTDLTQLYALRERISLPWLALTLLLYFSLTLLKALQYYFLIGRRVDYPQVLNIVVVQNAISNFIATSAGIASYLALFRVEQGVKVSRAALAFLLAKVGDLISIWLFMLVSSLLVWPLVASFHSLILLSLSFIGVAILVFFAAVFLRQKFVSVLAWFVEKLKLSRFGFVNKLMDLLASLAEQEHGFVFRMVGTGIAFSLIYMTVTMLWLYASLQTFSFEIQFLQVVFVNIFMQLISYLPIQVFGGLGVNETTSLYLYGIFNFPQTELAATLIGTRLLFYLTNLVVLLYLPVHTLFFSRSAQKQ
ncbi:MAG TPA: lysylphosphatidylglycerol synthase transmembrane domain-containing protein, partial [Anaerolineales bacterium]|nr:lysylphosphatidylglycerol synthase transmembrane domain-containing protein [Anaerolineales bacterium]